MKLFVSDVYTGLAIFLITLSIICQIMVGVLYQSMINETDNMSATDNKLLKQCKLKFANCYQLNSGVDNISVFVDKFINRIRLGWFTLNGVASSAGQMMLLAVLVSGIGIYTKIVAGSYPVELLPYYVVCLVGLYAYFCISSLVDIRGKKAILKTNLVDYLENHMVSRLRVLPKESVMKEILHGSAAERKTIPFGKKEKMELEELLREFLS